MMAESPFEQLNLCFNPVHRRIDFMPSATGWCDTIDKVYRLLRNDIGVSRDLPVEALRYYCFGLFWIRATSIKLQLGRDITRAELDLQCVFKGETLAIPEPIYIGLEAIGRTDTRNGEVLVPQFPDLPTTVTMDIPGGMGAVSADNHNVYEDLPIMGPAYQGCYQRAQTTDSQAYASVFAPQNTTANRNLQGFDRLAACRSDTLNLLRTMGFEEGERPGTIAHSGISYNAMKTVSSYLLTRTSRCEVIETNVFSIPVTGSIAQIIAQVPALDTIGDFDRASNLDITLQAYSNELRRYIGISAVFGLCQYKAMGADNDPSSWSSITYTEEAPMPSASIENRNARRNLPPRFNDRVFYTASDNAGDLRSTVISKFGARQ